MAWVGLDDHIDEHPKIAMAGPLASWVFVRSICYSNRMLTDGFVPRAVARELGATPTVIRKLLDARLWEESDGGYRVHDYAVYQPSKLQVLARRAGTKNRVAKWRGGNANVTVLHNGYNDVTNDNVTGNVTAENDVGNTAPNPNPNPNKNEEIQKERRETPNASLRAPILEAWNRMVPSNLQRSTDLDWLRRLQAGTAVNVASEIPKAAAWVDANPERKPAKNWRKYMTNWVNRAQTNGPANMQDFEPPATADQLEARIAETQVILEKATDPRFRMALQKTLARVTSERKAMDYER